MQNNKNSEYNNIDKIYKEIRNKIKSAKIRIMKTVNSEMIDTYWHIGKIMMEIQQGDARGEYGKMVAEKLSERLVNEFGKGFSVYNIRRMRSFYNCYPIRATLSHELEWSHYVELVKIENKKARQFYMQEIINSNWSVRELQRQKNSLLYERLILSKDKGKIKELSKKGQVINSPEDLIKQPLILEFLNIKENITYSENDLEKSLIKHLKEFLLELGKGFSFIGNQQRLKIGDDYFYIDLLFYNRLAKCFVIIDLKIGKLTHQDIGQMQMYVNYYKRTQMRSDENEPIGILLCADKDEAVVKFTLPDGNKNIFTSKYKLYIPTEQELIEEIRKEKSNVELLKDI